MFDELRRLKAQFIQTVCGGRDDKYSGHKSFNAFCNIVAVYVSFSMAKYFSNPFHSISYLLVLALLYPA